MLITPFNVKCERDSLLCSLCVVYFYVSDIRRTTVLQRRSRSRLVSLATTHLADEEMAKPTQRERWKGREGTPHTCILLSSLPLRHLISPLCCSSSVEDYKSLYRSSHSLFPHTQTNTTSDKTASQCRLHSIPDIVCLCLCVCACRVSVISTGLLGCQVHYPSWRC